MIKDFLRLALRSLTRRRMRSWLTLIGIFIGIAAVVSLISLGSGLKLAVANQFNILGAERIVVQAKGLTFGPPGSNVANPLTKDDLKLIQNVRGVEIAAGRVIQTALATADDELFVTYIGSNPKDHDEKEWINEIGNLDIEFGRELKPSDKYKITIGSSYHEEGNEVVLDLGDQVEIKGIDFEVVGIHEKKGAFTTDGIVVMNEEIVRELYDNENEYSLIGAKAANLDDIDLVAERISTALRRDRDLEIGKEDFEVTTNTQAFESISETLDIVTILLTGIAGISLIVGGVGITNTMFTSVLERQSEIGIMKAIGARNKDIFVIFFLESGILGMVGGIIGILLGVGIGKLVEFFGTAALGSDLLKASFTPELIIGALLFSFIVGAVAGTTPAIRASKMNPVDALRD